MIREGRGGGRPKGYPKSGGRQKGALSKADVRKTVAKLATKEGCSQLAVNASEIAGLLMCHLRNTTDSDKFFTYIAVIAPFLWLKAAEVVATPAEDAKTIDTKPLTADEIAFLKTVKL